MKFIILTLLATAAFLAAIYFGRWLGRSIAAKRNARSQNRSFSPGRKSPLYCATIAIMPLTLPFRPFYCFLIMISLYFIMTRFSS